MVASKLMRLALVGLGLLVSACAVGSDEAIGEAEQASHCGGLDAGGDDFCDGPSPCTGGNTTSCDDNCPGASNVGQEDLDGDGEGDVCDDDDDDDTVDDLGDNCPLTWNSNQ